MTRFMMSLPDAVELVLFAFDNGAQGDTFVQKAPAATIITLVEALKKMFDSTSDVKIIGTRHGEKKHEALLSKEEMLKAEDMGDYYRVPADTRDLNYAQYYEEGDKSLTEKGDYTSENTERLDVDGLINLLMKLDYIKQQMKG
jgi:UDP-N-acetylglucosamine 4,6-dehydratase